jgi:DUF1009 family protein
MKAAGVDRVVLAGGVTSRPHVSDLKLDWPTLRACLTFCGHWDKVTMRYCAHS